MICWALLNIHDVSFCPFLTIQEAYEYAKDLLTKNQAKHKALAEALLKYETLTSDEMRDIIAGKSLTRTI